MRPTETILLSMAEPEEITHPQHAPKKRGVFARLLNHFMKFKPNDFNLEDWQKLESRRGPPPCPARDAMTTYEGRK